MNIAAVLLIALSLGREDIDKISKLFIADATNDTIIPKSGAGRMPTFDNIDLLILARLPEENLVQKLAAMIRNSKGPWTEKNPNREDLQRLEEEMDIPNLAQKIERAILWQSKKKNANGPSISKMRKDRISCLESLLTTQKSKNESIRKMEIKNAVWMNMAEKYDLLKHYRLPSEMKIIDRKIVSFFRSQDGNSHHGECWVSSMLIKIDGGNTFIARSFDRPVSLNTAKEEAQKLISNLAG